MSTQSDDGFIDNGFIKAASLDDIKPGTMLCVFLAGKRILLANDEGTIYAADEMCTHEDYSLCTGSLKGHLVKCSLHGSRFDLKTGRATQLPAVMDIKTYNVKVENGSVMAAV